MLQLDLYPLNYLPFLEKIKTLCTHRESKLSTLVLILAPLSSTE